MKAYRGSRSTAPLSKYWPDLKNVIFNTKKIGLEAMTPASS
jgi:hypothetical protein